LVASSSRVTRQAKSASQRAQCVDAERRVDALDAVNGRQAQAGSLCERSLGELADPPEFEGGHGDVLADPPSFWSACRSSSAHCSARAYVSKRRPDRDPIIRLARSVRILARGAGIGGADAVVVWVRLIRLFVAHPACAVTL
jgi:hypothetical protein